MNEYIISINPPYDEQILNGVKEGNAEYRRASFRTVAEALPVRFHIYTTRPEQVFKGWFDCKSIDKLPDCWALNIAGTGRYAEPLSLADARERFGFRPPISHRGRVPANEELFRVLNSLTNT